MGYPLKINGQSIVFPSKADAEAFLRDVVLSTTSAPSANETPPSPTRIRRERAGAAAKAVETPKEANGFDALDLAIKFVKAIDAAGPQGLKLNAVMKVLGITDHRAMGNRRRFINREFASAAVIPDLAYTNDHGPDGARVWKPTPTSKKVIEILENHRFTRDLQKQTRRVA